MLKKNVIFFFIDFDNVKVWKKTLNFKGALLQSSIQTSIRFKIFLKARQKNVL